MSEEFVTVQEQIESSCEDERGNVGFPSFVRLAAEEAACLGG
jgi:hypothetical protein